MSPAPAPAPQARLLFPDHPIELLVSLGCGSTPLARRERSLSAYLDTGSVLIESACTVDRTDEALATVLPLVPGIKYFRCGVVVVKNIPWCAVWVHAGLQVKFCAGVHRAWRVRHALPTLMLLHCPDAPSLP
jgi:hypothetical protein